MSKNQMQFSFPDEFVSRMRAMLGEEYEDFIKSYERPLRNALRVNTLKISPSSFETWMERKMEPVPWTENGFYMDMEKRYFSSHTCYQAGLYYIQEASAMLPAALLQAEPGERVLDMCAAPGGKSTEIAACMKGEGALVSNDVSSSRAKALVHNLETMGMTNTIVTSAYPAKLAEQLPGYFDRILIDAPCSGEGMFHKEPAMIESWKRNGPAYYHEIQKELLAQAAILLAPGGRIVYSTCTFSPLEDEGSIAWFLQQFPDFTLADIHELSLTWEERAKEDLSHGRGEWLDIHMEGEPVVLADERVRRELAKTLRIWPHKAKGEGHFAAVLVKKQDSSSGKSNAAGEGSSEAESGMMAGRLKKKDRRSKKTNQPGNRAGAQAVKADPLEPFFAFLKDAGIRYPFEAERLRLSDGFLSYMPADSPDLPGVYILRGGWFLGEIRKGRFEPSGAFARGLRSTDSDQTLSLPSDGPEVRSYLKCETLPAAGADSEKVHDGWNLVCTEGYSLGWCKVSGGRIKNKYPAGWRVFY